MTPEGFQVGCSPKTTPQQGKILVPRIVTEHQEENGKHSRRQKPFQAVSGPMSPQNSDKREVEETKLEGVTRNVEGR